MGCASSIPSEHISETQDQLLSKQTVQKKPSVVINNSQPLTLSSKSHKKPSFKQPQPVKSIAKCNPHQLYSKTVQNKPDTVQFKVKTEAYTSDENSDQLKREFYISVLYSQQQTLDCIFTKIEKKMQKIFKPLKVKIYELGGDRDTSFIWCIHYNTEYMNYGDLYYQMESIRNKPITAYNKRDIINKGLSIQIEIKYQHKFKNISIDCEYMKQMNTDNPLQCPIYYAMKQRYEFSKPNLDHMIDYNHFHNEYQCKQECNFGQDCKVYIRCENGENRLDDQCHMKMYRHPPRTRYIELAENISSFVFKDGHGTIKCKIHEVYEPQWADEQKYGNWIATERCTVLDTKDGYLQALIEEVINNGYKYDLCLQCGKLDECKHQQYSILQIVDEKMQHIRHKAIGSPLRRDYMLALILYTGCDCNYDLCLAQRNGDYDKWKWFDYCLFHAIFILSKKETGSFNVYSGLNGVRLHKKKVKSGYFVTYVSTSWEKQVANNFMKGEGMIIQMDGSHMSYGWVFCCDVSWISKFPDECEILFARSHHPFANFAGHVLDESNGVQKVLLSRKLAT